MKRWWGRGRNENEEVLREFLLTFFCLCGICTGRWKGHLTSSGEAAIPHFTAACEKRLTREGWIIFIEGEGLRKCSTTGRLIRRGHIDLLEATHSIAKRKGRRRGKVLLLWRTR